MLEVYENLNGIGSTCLPTFGNVPACMRAVKLRPDILKQARTP